MAHVPPKAEALSMCLKPGVNIASHTEFVYLFSSPASTYACQGRTRQSEADDFLGQCLRPVWGPCFAFVQRCTPLLAPLLTPHDVERGVEKAHYGREMSTAVLSENLCLQARTINPLLNSLNSIEENQQSIQIYFPALSIFSWPFIS
jgi:hypothetical protein